MVPIECEYSAVPSSNRTAFDHAGASQDVRYTTRLAEADAVASVGSKGDSYEVSRRRGSHPPPLSEPCLTVSRYTAPIAEPVGIAPCFQ